MKKIIIWIYSFICLFPLRLLGAKIPFTSYIGPKKHIKGASRLKIGKNTRIRYDSSILIYSKYNGKQIASSVQIGDNVFINSGFKAIVALELTIQNNVTIANNVSVITENHGTNAASKSYLDNDLDTKPVMIKNGSWIGENVIILPGVTIGEKSIIGAGSVVTKDIHSYTIAVGNPAREIKEFNNKTGVWEKKL